MTAIAGLWRLDGRPDAGAACERMLAPLQIYGRDGVAVWSDRDIALGRRLQRVLPEDAFDQRPLVGPSGRVVVADLRLDNRDELAAALGIPGDRLAGLCDAAVLLAALERWSVDAFDRLAGDYACAVWDPARRRLTLACDPTARRALYYHRAPGLFAFASLPKGLHALPETPCEVDAERAAAWLIVPSTTGAGQLFKGVERVGAGTCVVVSDTGAEIRQHWSPRPNTVRLRSADDYAEGLRERLDQAVACRLRGASDVGAQLSAGYDSGAVAATAARLLAGKGRVHAFTAVPRDGYDDGGASNRLLDEGPLAAATAALYPNIEHQLAPASGGSPLAGLDRNFLFYEQPLANLCNQVWADAINAAAKARGLKVLLVGDLGNIGLSYAGWELLPELLRAGRWGRWLGEARGLVAHGHRWRGVLANSFGGWVPPPLWRLARRAGGTPPLDPRRFALINPGLASAAAQRRWAEAGGMDLANRPTLDAFAARMAALRRGGSVTHQGVLAEHGLDIRDPTSDRRLLEFCLGVPTEQFLVDGQPRALARRALADRLPADVLNAPRRGLQGADWHEGFVADAARLAREVESIAATPLAAEVLDIARLRRLVEGWPKAGWHTAEIRETYRTALLRGLSMGHFLRRAAGTNV